MATEPKTQIVSLNNGGQKIHAVLVLPGTRGRHAAIIAIHEWWGLNDWVKGQAKNLAANGYAVLAIDLYRGKVAAEESDARKLKRRLPHERAIRDLKAAFSYLSERSDVDADNIGSIGWSLGGYFALQLAMNEPRLVACVVNYGKLPSDLVDVQKINASVLGNFGALDRGIPPQVVKAFEKNMRSLTKSADMKVYAGARHGFENSDNPRRYRPEAAADAWSRTIAFFSAQLRGRTPVKRASETPKAAASSRTRGSSANR